MSIARHHAEWLSLVEVSGPFLSMPALLRAFPDGLDKPDDSSTLRSNLSAAHEEWLDNQAGLKPDPGIHRAWVRFVLRELLELEDEVLLEGQAIPAGLSVRVPEQHDELRPDLVLADAPGRSSTPRMHICVVPRAQRLEAALSGARWKASPAARMMTLLHGLAGARLGLVTNGEQWMLVHAVPGETTTYASFYASLFLEEPLTLRAFTSLLGARRFFAVPDADTLEALFKESGQNQAEVTDQLGAQVRRAVEVLIQSIDRIDRDRGRALLRGFDEKVLYEAAVTVMMRLVFLLAAEERGLLLLGDPLYDQHYATSTLRDQLQAVAEQHGPEVLSRRHDAWSRLLATFRAVYGGVRHEAMRLPAYGGSLFDPDRFPFLEGRAQGTSFRLEAASPLPIDNLTVLDLLTSLQVLEVKVPGGGPAEARRLSFRALDVEQIGHVYEGLLDHTAKRARSPVLSLRGTGGLEPEIEIERLDAIKAQGEEALLDFVNKETGRSRSALKKAVAYEVDEDAKRRFLLACDNKDQLYERVAPWAGLVREDAHGLPVVFDEGAVYVTEGTERRATGTHYTPKSLTEPIVQHTLEPLVYEGPAEGWEKSRWRLKSARELLALRVCDLAMGSGAFLVQACRYLSERLVEAWSDAEQEAGGRLVVTPEGDLATGAPNERPIPRDVEERLAIARRAVADRCLYGVDKNPMAVEMAKLSLWLVTLQKDKPFTFVDHALRCGDSLLGLTSLAQLTSFHLDPARGRRLHSTMVPFTAGIEAAVRRGASLRAELTGFAVESIADAARKEALLAEAVATMADLRVVADLVIGAALATAGRRGAALDDELLGLSVGLPGFLGEGAEGGARDEFHAEAQRRRGRELGEEARRLIDQGRGPQHAERRTFHWALEFPEVLEHGGFDAFVGNPPFQGGQRITGAVGTDYRDYLVEQLADGARGSADLVAYFFLRAGKLLREQGLAGMIATNTIAQGDTREVGLDQLVAGGFVIPRAVPSRKWPGDANLEVAHVWVRRGGWAGERMLDDAPAKGITSALTKPGAVVGKPHRLAANTGKSFIGSYVLGLGFTMSPEDAQALIARDERNRDVLFPYLNGQDLNSSPEQAPSRWVINFRDWPLDRDSAPAGYNGPVAADYRECLDIVRRLAKPQRDELAGRNSTGDDRARRWWQFARATLDSYAAIQVMERVLARARVSNINSIAFVSTGIVASEATVVFPFATARYLALLQGYAHTAWLEQQASSMRTDVRYTPSDCLETFPFPLTIDGLEDIGARYDAHRRSVMLARQEGLTKTYNRFHAPGETSGDIRTLRELHVEMDQAVAAAYGWTDLELGHGFHETKQGTRFTISEPARQEVLDRLLALNHERYEEEVRQGLHDKKRKKAKAERPAAAPSRPKRYGPAQTALDLGEPPPPQTGFDFDADPAPASLGGAADALSPDAQALLAALRASPTPLGKSALLEATGLPDKSWPPALNELKSKSLIAQQGTRRGATYEARPHGQQ